MSNTQVTGGTVSVEDGTKAAVEYQPPRKVRVELTFSVAEGDDASVWLTRVSDLASAKVHELLGRAPRSQQPVTDQAQLAAEPEAQRRTRRTQAQIAADKAAEGNGSPTTSSGSPASAADPQGSGGAADTAASPSPAQPAAEDPATSAASGDDDEWGSDAATVEIADKELNDACGSAAERLGNPQQVKDAIQAFNTKPAGEKFKVTEIPQGQRRAFLDKLAALTKA